MEQELLHLGERVDRLIAITRRLADENAGLRDRLNAATATHDELQQRIADARARIEAAMTHLPRAPDPNGRDRIGQ
jgi:uncharacterized protein (TIGR02449 family)